MKRVHLVDENGYSLPLVRRAAVALADFFVNYDKGCVKGDPIFEYVTEGIQTSHDSLLAKGIVKEPYSACGHLPPTIMFHLGNRDESLMNRTNDGGKIQWLVSQNISILTGHKNWHTFDSRSIDEGGDWPAMGDFIVTASPYHVEVFNDFTFNDDNTGFMTAFAYGQVKGGIAAACRKTRPIHLQGNKLMIESKHLVGFISLFDLNLTMSAIVPDSFVGGIEDTTTIEPGIEILPGLNSHLTG